MCDTTPLRHGMWLIQMSDVTHSHVRRDSFRYGTWLIYICLYSCALAALDFFSPCVHIHIWTYTCTCVNMCMYVYTYRHIHFCFGMCPHAHTHINLCMYECRHVYVCIYLWTYPFFFGVCPRSHTHINICIDVNMCMYVYIYMLTHIFEWMGHITHESWLFSHMNQSFYVRMSYVTYEWVTHMNESYHTHTHIYVNMFIYIHNSMCYLHARKWYVHEWVMSHMIASRHTWMRCTCMYAYIYIHQYLILLMYVYVYIYVCIHIHTSTYTYINIWFLHAQRQWMSPVAYEWVMSHTYL